MINSLGTLIVILLFILAVVFGIGLTLFLYITICGVEFVSFRDNTRDDKTSLY